MVDDTWKKKRERIVEPHSCRFLIHFHRTKVRSTSGCPLFGQPRHTPGNKSVLPFFLLKDLSHFQLQSGKQGAVHRVGAAKYLYQLEAPLRVLIDLDLLLLGRNE